MLFSESVVIASKLLEFLNFERILLNCDAVVFIDDFLNEQNRGLILGKLLQQLFINFIVQIGGYFLQRFEANANANDVVVKNSCASLLLLVTME